MIDGLMKICGALFIGGIGLCMILASVLLTTVLLKELIDRYGDKFK